MSDRPTDGATKSWILSNWVTGLSLLLVTLLSIIGFFGVKEMNANTAGFARVEQTMGALRDTVADLDTSVKLLRNDVQHYDEVKQTVAGLQRDFAAHMVNYASLKAQVEAMEARLDRNGK